jgi:hypothetical protein
LLPVDLDGDGVSELAMSEPGGIAIAKVSADGSAIDSRKHVLGAGSVVELAAAPGSSVYAVVKFDCAPACTSACGGSCLLGVCLECGDDGGCDDGSDGGS